MPFLELTEAAIAQPTSRDLFHVEAVMLYPRDEAARRRFFEARAADYLADLARRSPVELVTDDAMVLVAAVEFVHRAPRLSEFRTDERWRWGTITGLTLAEAIGWYQLKPRRGGLARIREDIVRRCLSRSVSEKTRERWWQQFRPAAPLWAAQNYLIDEALDAGQDRPPFPCPMDQLAHFLALVEWYRQTGEKTVTPQAPGPILPPGEAFAVPPGLAVPRVSITFERRRSN